jgi:hypothetical protein
MMTILMLLRLTDLAKIAGLFRGPRKNSHAGWPCWHGATQDVRIIKQMGQVQHRDDCCAACGRDAAAT